MKRVNGYLDLEEYFKRISKKSKIDLEYLEEKNIIKANMYSGSSALFWFKYFDVDVLFKDFDNDYSSYSELISQELAHQLGFKSALYDLATFREYRGVITYDFKKANYNYVSFYKVLNTYIRHLNKLSDISYDVSLYDYYKEDKLTIANNLEDLWNALEHYLYASKIKKELIPNLIKKLMLQLTDYFSYQIISGNFDMHCSNVVLAIAKDGSDAELAPLHDNEDMYKLSGEITYQFPFTPSLALERNDFVNQNFYLDIIKKYLKISDESFVKRFQEIINKIDDLTIYNVVANVEERIDSTIPLEVKRPLIKAFNENIIQLKEIIDELNQKRKR